MSFDVFFQGFHHGEASSSGAPAMAEILKPYLKRDGGRVWLELPDGECDLYFSEQGLMVNHATGAAVWDVLVEGARMADWVILPVGCPTVLTRASQRDDLPPELTADDVVCVDTGSDLLDVIRPS